MAITKINNLGITFPVPFTAGTAALPSLTFAGDTNTGVFAPAADTIAFTEGGTEAMRIDSSANLQFNSGYGSVATAFGCRAWVNFNGQGTPAIRGSGNVSSITDHSTGLFSINFTTAISDANYAFVATGEANRCFAQDNPTAPTTTACKFFQSVTSTLQAADSAFMCVAIFR